MAATGRSARQLTPASPSPSPEPSGTADQQGQGAAGGNLGGLGAPFLAKDDAFSFGRSDNGALAGEGNSSAAFLSGAGSSNVPFHEVMDVGRDDPHEPLRQHVQECTRNVIDSLYQLAVCAADVQPDREDIVGAKVNETISHLAALSTASSSNPDGLPSIPQEVLEAIDEGRNPDALSKNRMARLVSDNQQLAGQRWALEEYRQLLAHSISDVFPELAPSLEDLERRHRSQRTQVGDVTDQQQQQQQQQDMDQVMMPPPSKPGT